MAISKRTKRYWVQAIVAVALAMLGASIDGGVGKVLFLAGTIGVLLTGAVFVFTGDVALLGKRPSDDSEE